MLFGESVSAQTALGLLLLLLLLLPPLSLVPLMQTQRRKKEKIFPSIFFRSLYSFTTLAYFCQSECVLLYYSYVYERKYVRTCTYGMYVCSYLIAIASYFTFK